MKIGNVALILLQTEKVCVESPLHKKWNQYPRMLMGHTVDDIATSWHSDAGPFDVSTPIISHTRCTTRLNFILNLYQRNSIEYKDRKSVV